MKKFCRIFKLLPPAFLMRRWLDRRYGIKVLPVPGNMMVRFVFAILPYAFTAMLSVRVESDTRLLKYFLPYGMVKNVVKCVCGKNDAKDIGVVGTCRAIMPCGLVLWWDTEDKRMSSDKRMYSLPKIAPAHPATSCPKSRIQEGERQKLAHLDKVEAKILRLLILSYGRAEK